MKCTLIVDSLGPNPAFDPPQRDHFPDDEAYHDALALYEVPPDIMVPAGTVLSGPFAWLHCLPDQSGWGRDAQGKPVRVRPGVVRSVPLDAPCQVKVAKEVQALAAKRKVLPAVVMAEIDAAIKKSQDAQAANSKPAPATAVKPAA
ncbi:MAG TPA: hypothetical protein VGH74_07585 [Planctomycetaceae bacterium]|jgi:hypothetical protein